MTTMCANAKLVKGYRIDVDDGHDHAICLDLQPPSGTNMGPSALELAIMAHAGCYATIFVMTANKMRMPIKDLEVHEEAIKTDEAGTVTEATLDIVIKADAPADRIQRIHELTLQGCPVGKIFEKANVKLKYNLKTET